MYALVEFEGKIMGKIPGDYPISVCILCTYRWEDDIGKRGCINKIVRKMTGQTSSLWVPIFTC